MVQQEFMYVYLMEAKTYAQECKFEDELCLLWKEQWNWGLDTSFKPSLSSYWAFNITLLGFGQFICNSNISQTCRPFQRSNKILE